MLTILCEAQSGFDPGRKIVDNIIMDNELVRAYARKHISPRCTLKIDLHKTYDSVEWRYVEQMLEGLCFPTTFIQCILECVQTVHYSIIVNGEPTKPLDYAKGVR